MSARWRVAIGVVAGALLLRVTYGPPRLGYDAWYALSWGRDLAHGVNPSFGGAQAPTPHPLANVISAVLSVFGSRGPTAVAATSLLALAALGAALLELGRRLFGLPGGVLVAVVVLTRPRVVDEMLFCSADVPFLALVAWAGVTLAGPRSRPARALVLLAAAGLLRPEAWLLSAVLAVWCVSRGPGASRRWLVLGVVAAPAIWATFDLAVTGDALHSLHGTQDLAEEFGRPRSAGTAFTALPDYIRVVLGTQVAWAGVLSALAALWLAMERAALPLAVAALGALSFLLLGAADLPLLYRYALLPGLALVSLIGYGAFAWTDGAAPAALRWVLGGMGIAIAVLLAGSVSGDRRELRVVTAGSRALHTAQADLARLTTLQRVEVMAATCRTIAVPGPRVVPELAYRLGRSSHEVSVAGRGVLATAAFSPAAGRLAASYRLNSGDAETLSAKQLGAATLVSSNASWSAYGAGTCPAPSRLPGG